MNTNEILTRLLNLVSPLYRTIHREKLAVARPTGPLQLTDNGFKIDFTDGFIELHKAPWKGRPLRLTCHCETGEGQDSFTQQMPETMLALYEQVVDSLLT